MPHQTAKPDRRDAGWNRGARRALGAGAIASLALAAALGIFIFLFQPHWNHEEEVLVTVSLFGVSSALALSCVWTREASHPHALWTIVLWGGIASAVLGWVSVATAVWIPEFVQGPRRSSWIDSAEFLARTGGAAYFASASIVYCALFSRFRVRGAAFWVRSAGMAGAVVCASVLALMILSDDFDEWQGRVIGATGIVAGSSLVIAPLMAAIFPSMRVGRAEAARSERLVPFVCPACAAAQTVVVGRRVECCACGLGVEVRLDAPRCACGYDLTDLTAEVCPECGAPIEAKNRWALAAPAPGAKTIATEPAAPAV